MTCRDWQEQIALSLYGELSGAEARALEEHVAGCETCRDELAAMATTVALLRRESPPVPGTLSAAPVARRSGARWIAAAAVALAASVALAVALRSTRTPVAPPSEQLRPIVKVSPPLPAADRARAALAQGGDVALASILPLSLEAEDVLTSAATGPEPVVAIQAIEWLGSAGSRRASSALRTALATRLTRPAAFRAMRTRGELDLEADIAPALGDVALRREATEILSGMRNAKAYEILFSAALDGNAAARAACRAFPAGVALAALMKALDDPDRLDLAAELLLTTDGEEVRSSLALRCISDTQLRAAALTLAASDPADPRRARFLAICLASPTLAADARRAVIDIPVRKLKPALEAAMRDQSGRPELVAFLAERAAEREARELLILALDGPEARPEAARAVLQYGDTRPVKALLEAAGPEDIEAFGALPDPARRREMEKALRSPKLRRGALLAVKPDDGSLWPQIVPLLREESVRALAAEALARSGTERVIPYMIPFVTSTGDGARVRDALVSLAGVDAGDSSELWSRWWSTRRRD